MVLSSWSVLLIASASQCLFLIFFLLTKTNVNKQAKRLMILLLLVLFSMNMHNLWYASRIYLTILPEIAGHARGAVLLIGPLLYLYTKAVLDPLFKLRLLHLLHLLPYLLSWTLILSQPTGGYEMEFKRIEAFLMGGLPASPIVLVRLAIYAIHLITYVYLSRSLIKRSEKNTTHDYLITSEKRVKWLSQINYFFVLIAILKTVELISAYATSIFSVQANYINTLFYSVFVYLLAFKTFRGEKEIVPDFKKKYQGKPIDQEERTVLIERLTRLFEEEKVFKNHELKQAEVAGSIGLQPHELSALINGEMNSSFFEFVNDYRVKEFLAMAKDPAYSHLSIMGIAQEAGFRSKSSFNTIFKKITGQTPSEHLKKDF